MRILNDLQIHSNSLLFGCGRAWVRANGFFGAFTESIVEDAALAWLESLDYAVLHGPDIAPGEPAADRAIVWIM